MKSVCVAQTTMSKRVASNLNYLWNKQYKTQQKINHLTESWYSYSISVISASLDYMYDACFPRPDTGDITQRQTTMFLRRHFNVMTLFQRPYNVIL